MTKISEDGYTLDEFTDDMRRDMSKTPRPCRSCGETWTPKSWNFYDLCERCFEEFDYQKMKGRFQFLHEDYDESKRKPWFESSAQWIESKKTQK